MLLLLCIAWKRNRSFWESVTCPGALYTLPYFCVSLIFPPICEKNKGYPGIFWWAWINLVPGASKQQQVTFSNKLPPAFFNAKSFKCYFNPTILHNLSGSNPRCFFFIRPTNYMQIANIQIQNRQCIYVKNLYFLLLITVMNFVFNVVYTLRWIHSNSNIFF